MVEGEEIFGDGFYYWGNEGGGDDQTQLILQLSEQVADLQTTVEEQSAFLDELSEGVVYKGGAVKPMRGGIGGGIGGRMIRIPFMSPKAIAKTGVRMGIAQGLKAAGISIPFLGAIIAIGFALYEGTIKMIAEKAANDAVREHEAKETEKRKELYADIISEIERKRRESYRSVVP